MAPLPVSHARLTQKVSIDIGAVLKRVNGVPVIRERKRRLDRIGRLYEEQLVSNNLSKDAYLVPHRNRLFHVSIGWKEAH